MSIANPPVFQLNVKVNHILLHRGKIMIAIYDNDHDFMKKPLQKRTVELADFKKDIIFSNLKEGEYAVALFQDLDGDNKLNKVASMPTEPYGLSNDPDGFPNWEETKFQINENATIIVTLKN